MAASSRRFPPRSSLSARRVLRNLVAFALLYGAGLAAVWGFSLLGVSTLVAFPVFVLGVLIASPGDRLGAVGRRAGSGLPALLRLPVHRAPLHAEGAQPHRRGGARHLPRRVAHHGRDHPPHEPPGAGGRAHGLRAGAAESAERRLLESSTPQAACSFAQEFLTRVLRRPVTITLGEPPAAGSAAARDCYERRAPTGYGEPGYRDEREKYLPLGMKGRLYGVVAIDCSSGDVDSGSPLPRQRRGGPDPRGRGAQRAGGRRARRRRRPSGHIGPVQRQERCRTDTSGSALID